jgi:hypothetical protein
MLAKIIGKVMSSLLCALLTGMRFRSKHYLCWLRRRLPQCMYTIHLVTSSLPRLRGTVSNSQRLLDNSTYKIQFTLLLNFESHYN